MRGGDFVHNWKQSQSFAPAARTATANGVAVDTQHDKRTAFDIDAGLWTDGVETFTFESSPDNSTWTAIPAAELIAGPSTTLIGASVVVNAANDNQHHRIEYVGGKRYVRVVLTASGTTTGLVFGASVAHGDHRYAGSSQFAT